MRRIAFFVVFTCLIFSFGLANGQETWIKPYITTGYFPEPDTLDGLDSIAHQGVIEIDLVYCNSTNCRQFPTNGYVLKSKHGATWTGFDIISLNPIGFGVPPGGMTKTKGYPIGNPPDGVSPDYLGVGGVGVFDSGWVSGANSGYLGPYPWKYATYTLTFELDGMFEGDTLVLDSATFTGFSWVWSQLTCGAPETTANIKPTWLGPYEMVLYVIPDLAPVFPVDSLPAGNTLTGSHCAPITYDFYAYDPDPHEGTNTLTFSTDLGTINSASGVFSYTGSIADVYESVVAHITATEDDATFKTIEIDIEATNVAPVISAGFCGQTFVVGTDKDNTITFSSTDNCPGDPENWYIVNDGGIDSIYFAGSVLHVYPVAAEIGNVTIEIGVTDTKDASECELTLSITSGFTVKIEKDEGTSGLGAYQGQFTDVDVFIDGYPELLGGFDFLIAYDASALTFMGANTDNSALYQTCGWEYFVYRFGPFGNCGSACPSGQLRVVGMAETNNGADHPTCWNVGTNLIAFTMKFLVSNDRNLNCSFVPIRFFWIDCGDNTVTNKDGDKLSIVKELGVYDYTGILPTNYLVIDIEPVFPTYAGAEDICETNDKIAVSRDIFFYNGGVDIICSDDVDDRGDINLDGLAYSIADAVMFTNYFIYGLNAFENTLYPNAYLGSIAASDVNADGIPLTVSDLVYLIRVIIGDAVAYAKVVAVNGTYAFENNVLSVDQEMGAIYLELDRNADVELLASGMEMKTNNGKVIVYSLEGNAVNGQVLRTDANIINIEMAAKDGSPVSLVEVPRNFALSQNYPNPFNPVTTIEFSLSEATDYSLTIYNVTGQVVDVFSGSANAGFHKVEWDATNVASGIYFYKLDAGNFSETKKMVLLK